MAIGAGRTAGVVAEEGGRGGDEGAAGRGGGGADTGGAVAAAAAAWAAAGMAIVGEATDGRGPLPPARNGPAAADGGSWLGGTDRMPLSRDSGARPRKPSGVMMVLCAPLVV